MDSLLNCRHKSDRKSSYGDAVKELDSAVGEIIDLLVKMKIENKVSSGQLCANCIWSPLGYNFRHWLFSPATMELREFPLGLGKEVLMGHCYVGSKLHLRVA